MEEQLRTVAADPQWWDWANLPSDMTNLVAERVLSDDVASLIRFRAACRPWRQRSPVPHAQQGMDHRFHPRKWMMTAGRMPKTLRRFCNTSTGERICVELPELAGHAFPRFPDTSLEGLLLLRNKRTHAIRLLNPLTRQLTNLPPATTLMGRGHPSRYYEVTTAYFSDGNAVVAYFGKAMRIAVARSGDGQWIGIDGK